MSQQRATVQRTGGTTATIPLATALQREVDAALRCGIPTRIVAEAKQKTPFDAAPETFADTLNSLVARELAVSVPSRTPSPKAKARVTPKPSPEPDDPDDDEDPDEPDDSALIRCKSPGCGLKSPKGARYCARCGASLNQGTEPAGGDDDAALKAGLAALDRQVRCAMGDPSARREVSAPTFATPTTSAPVQPLVLSRNLEGRPSHENLALPQRAARAEHLIRNLDQGLRPPTVDASWFPTDRR